MTGRGRGFTLTEVMVALCLLTIAVFGLVGVQAYAVRSSELNRQRYLASELAASEMADIESLLRERFRPVARPRSPVAGRDGFESQVEEAFEDASKRLKHVTVTIFYRDEHGLNSYVLWSVFYDPWENSGDV